jgi:hypothetical protein
MIINRITDYKFGNQNDMHAHISMLTWVSGLGLILDCGWMLHEPDLLKLQFPQLDLL